MSVVLGDNRYGKIEVHVVRVSRRGETHDLLDWTVSVQLSGDFADTHLTGNNALVIPTDTQKNTVYALSKRLGATEPEAFALALGRHFLDGFSHVTAAHIRIVHHCWKRLGSAESPHPHAFARDASFEREVLLHLKRGRSGLLANLVSGISELTLLKSTASEFVGYLRDQFTTLKEAHDRIMATQVSARWRRPEQRPDELEGIDWGASHARVSGALMLAFADHHSLSLQQTLHLMAKRALEADDGLCAIKLSLPNRHHLLVDLSPFGLTNENEVFHAVDAGPFGLIEAVFARDGATVPPAWTDW